MQAAHTEERMSGPSHLLPLRRERGRKTRNALEARLGCLLLAVAAVAAPSSAQVREAKAASALQGKLSALSGTRPILKTPKKDYALAAKTNHLYATLQDKQLHNREVRLEGRMRPDGAFEVERLYTVRDGKLYKVRYFCEVCNIEALEPGDCVCCQKPTDLQESPLTEANP